MKWTYIGSHTLSCPLIETILLTKSGKFSRYIKFTDAPLFKNQEKETPHSEPLSLIMLVLVALIFLVYQPSKL